MADTSKPLSKESKLIRKSNKPLMEKKRRARINLHLNELAGLVSEGSKRENSRQSKMEKADILQMTVNYLKELQKQLSVQMVAANTIMNSKYRTGYNECANEVIRYLRTTHNIDDNVRNRIANHLANSIHQTEVSHKQNLNPASHVENLEKNIPKKAFTKLENLKQDPTTPVTSLVVPTLCNPSPMKARLPNISTPVPFSEIRIPSIYPSPSIKTSNSPRSAPSSPSNVPLQPDSFNRPENPRTHSKIVSVHSIESSPLTSAAVTTSQQTQTTGQYFHKQKHNVLLPATYNSLPESIPTSQPTKPTDNSKTKVTEPLLVKLNPPQVAGSFQIIPGPIYNGQPVAFYLAPTSALPAGSEYIPSPITNAPSLSTTVSPPIKSESLTLQVPQVVTAVVSPSTIGLISPQTAAPAPSSLNGSVGFGYIPSSLPQSASVSTSPNALQTSPRQSQPASSAQNMETEDSLPASCSNMQFLANDPSLWRPWSYKKQ